MARQHTAAYHEQQRPLLDVRRRARRRYRPEKVSPVEVVDAVLSRIDTLKQLNAYVTLDADPRRAAAKAAGAPSPGAAPSSGHSTASRSR
jgi:Asp-tRNA(Asn)/Glu-tRNA(Gln) amidotransferase A subunit family amidase